MALTRNRALFIIVALLGLLPTLAAATPSLQPTTPAPAAATTTTAVPLTSPSTGSLSTLTYSCDGNGKYELDFTAVTDFDSYIVTDGEAPGNNKTTTCSTPTLQAKATAAKFSLSGCTNTPYVYLMKDHVGQLQKVIGGKKFREYKLDCKLPEGGVIQNVSLSFGVTEPSPTTETAVNSNFNLTMVFTDGNKTEKSEFMLNQKLFLDIQDKSTAKHQLKLMRCDAYSSDGGNGDTANIYDVKSNNVANEIFDNVTTPTLGDVKVELRAFRFVSSFKTYIQCSVSVCNEKDGNCGTAQRRRRDVDGLESTSVVDGSFTVVQSESERPTASGQTTVLPWHASVMGILAFVVAAYTSRKEGQS